MGIQVELPTLRKNRLMGMLEKPSKGSKEMDHESWQWGAFEDLTIDDPKSHATRFNMNCGEDTATLGDSPGASAKHLISPSTSGSSPLSPSSPRSGTPSFRGGCVDSFGGSGTHRRLLRKRSDEKDLSSMSFSSNSEFRPSRWNSGRWSGSKNFEDSSAVRSHRRNRVCKCAAGVTADVAVVCCCPFSVLHLLAIAFIKLPAAVVSQTVTRVKHKVAAKRKRAASVHEEEVESIPATSCPPSRCRSYEAGDIQTWAPALSFGDQMMWRDCFDSPDTGLGNSEELLRGKS